MKIGVLDITDCKIGNVQVSEVRIGNTLVWSNAVAYDVDAQAYFTANTAITSTLDKDAINAYFVGLKADGIYTKMKAMYLPIWSSAAANKWNMKSPVDTDAAFRLAFFGGWTHNSNGITGNGTTAYADTFLNDQNDLSINDKHISMYQRNVLVSPSNVSMGAAGNVARFYLNFGGQNYATLGMPQSPFIVQTPQRGMFIMSKIIIGEFKYYQNSLAAVTKTGTNNANNSKYFLCANFNTASGQAAEFSVANLAFVSLGNGLSATESANLQTRTNTLMTHFGLNV